MIQITFVRGKTPIVPPADPPPTAPPQENRMVPFPRGLVTLFKGKDSEVQQPTMTPARALTNRPLRPALRKLQE